MPFGPLRSHPTLHAPLELHKRPFLITEKVCHVSDGVREADTNMEHDISVDCTDQVHVEVSSPLQEVYFDPELRSDTEFNQNHTSQLSHQSFESISRWSESSSEDAEAFEEGYNTTENEDSDSEANVSHFSIVEAHRLSIHTWILRPSSSSSTRESESISVSRHLHERTSGSSCRKEVKRWGIIF
ncbi:hypothetical protein NW762_014575 [Fusarium torreyae]|uniref:Uncharacterized protein n=1 Tax=Fusarium torreyae TaxID=1237075 RepID=A0A9W8V9A2_9HYPO|nr:hypothetical protein NW762_014575 [Fusarium torreyae]